jgi:hypothetical protein
MSHVRHGTPGWQNYKMEFGQRSGELKPPAAEKAAVVAALAVLVRPGLIPHARYDRQRFVAHKAQNLANQLAGGLALVRNPVAASVTGVVDNRGLEISRPEEARS